MPFKESSRRGADGVLLHRRLQMCQRSYLYGKIRENRRNVRKKLYYCSVPWRRGKDVKMKSIYDPLKLPEYTETFGKLRALVVGGGAVGSAAASLLTRMGVGVITVVDFGKWRDEHRAKCSDIIRFPEDVGEYKAVSLAKRAKAAMVSDGEVNGIAADVRDLGPMALADYDYILVGLDNYAAKIYINQMWLQLPEDTRPVLIFGGTNLEEAQSNCLDGKDACLRCLVDESWLVDSERSTSCVGAQYFVFDGKREAVRTSACASQMAALLMVNHLRKCALGHEEAKNTRYCYSPDFDPPITINSPMKKKNCPDCAGHSPLSDVRELSGSVMTTTLGEVMEKIREKLERQDFELFVNQTEFAGTGYSGIIEADFCHSCSKPIPNIFKHESRIRFEEILCDECKAAGRLAYYHPARPAARVIYGFSYNDIPEAAKNKTAYSLGWQIGGVLTVVLRNGASSLLDERAEIIDFTLADDRKLMKSTFSLCEEE